MIKHLLVVIILFFCSNAFSATLEIISPWIREAPPTAKNLAGYVELSNKSNSSITVSSASSDIFSRVEIHVTTFENGMMRMKEMKNLIIKPGETIYFEPGGKHFMLIKPKQAIKSGLVVPVTLKLTNGEVQVINFSVRK